MDLSVMAGMAEFAKFIVAMIGIALFCLAIEAIYDFHGGRSDNKNNHH